MTVSQINVGQLLEPSDDDGLIVRTPPERVLEAVEQLVALPDRAAASQPHWGRPIRTSGSRKQALRFVEYASANGINLERMWSRLGPDGSIMHTALAVANIGRTAMVFASHPSCAAEAASIGVLIERLGSAMRSEGIHLGQALLEPQEELERRAFVASGFTELARLSYLERSLGRTGDDAVIRWPADVSIEPYGDEKRSEVMGILESSYEKTLDCPGLFGLRETSDILDGHRATGRFEPELWSILRIDGRGAGVLLLNALPASGAIELVYLGLASWARGRGLGDLLLRHGLGLLFRRRERLITLAVDDANEPALALYRKAGFRRALRRVALIRSLRSGA